MAKSKVENQDETQPIVTPEAIEQPRKFKTVSTAAEFWDFDNEPVFEGIYSGNTSKREQDAGDEKAGDIMGYIFTDKEGEAHIIGNSHAIEKAMLTGEIKKDSLVRITFKGKGENAKGQPVNRFKIEVAE